MSVRSDVGVCRRCGLIELHQALLRVGDHTYECEACARPKPRRRGARA